MIKINIKKEEEIITEIKISGHAKYDTYGKDIVCAGVSSALITTVNACLTFDNNSIYYEEKNQFSLKNIKKDDITNKLLSNLENILKNIESTYNKYVKIKEE